MTITAANAREQLMQATSSVQTAVVVLRSAMPVMEQLLKESSDMDNFGHIIDPTLFRDSERRAVNALIEPVFRAAIQLVRTFDHQAAAGAAALQKVTAK